MKRHRNWTSMSSLCSLSRAHWHHQRKISELVPPVIPLSIEDRKQLLNFLTKKGNQKLLVITGAGVSTESGIPDYRGPAGSYSKGHKPVMFQDFIDSQSSRQRYWARNYKAWPIFSSFQPNPNHHLLKKFESLGIVDFLITQNVDRLHQKAGHQQILELHGNSYHVGCVQCKHTISRANFQDQLAVLNRHWKGSTQTYFGSNHQRPDGDVELQDADYTQFVVPSCSKCSGIMKPTVVFFGENIPKDVVEKSFEFVAQASKVLVIGTSLSVYSVFRLVKAAHDKHLPIVAINSGPTRADSFISLKLESRASTLLSELFDAIVHTK